MTDPVDDLLGLPVEPERRRRRVAKPKLSEDDLPIAMESMVRPMSVPQLSRVFGLDVETVRRRLQLVTAVGQTGNNRPVYKFLDAAPHLVRPIDLDAYIADMEPDDLPVICQARFWDAKLKRQKWEVNAGVLWPSEDVLEVLGDVFMTIKNATTLWITTVNETEELSVGQRKCLVNLVDTLGGDLHESLVEMPKQKQTRAQVAQLDDILGLES